MFLNETIKKASTAKLNLRNIILLDNESTMDLFCNKSIVNKITKSKSRLKVQSNGGSMYVTNKASIPGYKNKVWFSKNAITNIISLKHLIQQYWVTYDSNDETFVVHRDKDGLTNMEFQMHESGLHYYDPKNKQLTFVNTVSNNKESYSKKQVKEAETARALYAKLGYPSIKDFKWIIMSNQIQDCPVTTQDIDIAHAIWGKNIAALKGKATRLKPMQVAGNR